MKKVLLIMIVLIVAACAVKSDLVRAEGDTFPRNYPVY